MKTEHKTLKMEPELLARILKWCKDNDRSFNWFMAKAADDKLIAENKAQRAPLSDARAGAAAVESGERPCREGDKKHCLVKRSKVS